MVLFFILNALVIIIFAILLILFRQTNTKIVRTHNFLGQVTNTINSVRYGNLTTKLEKLENPTYKQLSSSINRMVETLNDREKMIIEYQMELTHQNEFLAATINSLSDGILIIEEHYKILLVTPQIENWFNEISANLIGRNLHEFIQSKENIDIKNFQKSEIFIKDDTNSTYEATTTNLKLNDNKKRLIIVIKNITDQRELEKLRENFIATLTHDLKVPIVAASNVLEFLIDGKFGSINEKQFEAISNMQKSNKELLELVHSILDTYKISDTGIRLNREPVNLTKLILDTVNEIQPTATKTGVKIVFNSQENIDFSVDTMMFKRVLKNILQNAISYSETKKDIEVTINETLDTIEVKITDYGKGIPKDDVDKIFNKYYSSANKFKKVGTGLGLYVSQQIMFAHNGKITVNSEENSKTEFCIILNKKF